MKETFKRKCPKCDKELSYTTKQTLQRSINESWLCWECRIKERRKNIKFSRNCPECGIELSYTQRNIHRAIKLNSLCKPCSKKGIKNYNFGGECKNKELLSKLLIGNKYNFGKYRTDEQRKIHSLKLKQFCQTIKGKECIRKRTESIRKTRSLLGTNGYHPNFNKKSCLFFDYLNKELKWNGKHALNGGEYYIGKLGNWVDYYEPTLNIVIEWDEYSPHHYKQGNLRHKDITRENKIKEYLKCKFIRIKETNDYDSAKNIILHNLP